MTRRVGFLGLGWIGRHRLRAIAEAGLVQVAALADPSEEAVAAAATMAPDASRGRTLDDLLGRDLDAVVIATPSARHAEESQRALEHGLAVFCQKPLARDAAEAARVVAAARRADRLLGVDLSYRHTTAGRILRDQVASGSLGTIYAVDLVFHNAYGPDKEWYYDRAASGGGCVMDLGIHLVDLVRWLLPGIELQVQASHLFREGRSWSPSDGGVEDFAMAQLATSTGGVVRLACSWRAPAGADAVIGAEFTGTRAAARLHNVGGSFYDFALERLDGTTTVPLVAPPDAWGGRAAVAWAQQLASSVRYDADADEQIGLANVLDAIYETAGAPSHLATAARPPAGRAR